VETRIAIGGDAKARAEPFRSRNSPAAPSTYCTAGKPLKNVRSIMAGLLRSLYLSYFSKPKGYRPLYRAIRKRPPTKIVELGIGTAERTLRMLELCAAGAETNYTGIDLFEARGEGAAPGLSLKAAHTKLSTTGVKVRLVPGDPFSALSRTANASAGQDLILISADQDRESLARAWFYVPRMMHPGTLVLLEETVNGEPVLSQLLLVDVETLAQAPKVRRAA